MRLFCVCWTLETEASLNTDSTSEENERRQFAEITVSAVIDTERHYLGLSTIILSFMEGDKLNDQSNVKETGKETQDTPPETVTKPSSQSKEVKEKGDVYSQVLDTTRVRMGCRES